MATRVLLIDDDLQILSILQKGLAFEGFEVYTAVDGESGLAATKQYQPHLILLDIAMPDLSGYDVARNLRLDTTSPRIVLIALTGYGQDGDKERAHEAGFDHHLTKPVDPSKLEALISGY